MLNYLTCVRNGRMALKWLTLCFCVLIVILGIASQIVGGFIIARYKEYLSHVHNSYTAVGAFFVFSGVLVTVVGIVGIIGTFQQKGNVITLFTTFVVLTLILEVTAAGLCFAFISKADDNVLKVMNSSLDKYPTDHRNKKFFDWVQKEFSCCGIKSSADWKGHGIDTPSSCCKRNETYVYCARELNNIYKEGCGTQFQNFVRINLTVVGGIALSIAILEVIGTAVTILFRKAIDLGAYELI